MLFTFEPLNVRYVETMEAIEEGLLIPLAPIFDAVDEYLLPGHARLAWGQRELGFGPQPINSTTDIQNPATAGKHDQARRTL
jgi:hypothetical protein